MIDAQDQCLKVIDKTYPDIQIRKENLSTVRQKLLEGLKKDPTNESNIAILIALSKYFPLNTQPIEKHNVFLTVSGQRHDFSKPISLDELHECDKKNYNKLITRKSELRFLYGFFSSIVLGMPTAWHSMFLIRNLIFPMGGVIPGGWALAIVSFVFAIVMLITLVMAYNALRIQNKISAKEWQHSVYAPNTKALLSEIETAIDKVSPKNCFQTCYARLFKVSNEPNKPPYVEPSLPSLP